MKDRSTRATAAGFTLLEILAVAVIVGIMASAVIVNVVKHPDKVRLKKALADIASVETALELYLMDHSGYPDSLSVLEPEYIKRLPNDPWGNAYLIFSPGSHGDADILSYGSDDVVGGDDIAADIGNWQLR